MSGANASKLAYLSWSQILRLGAVQAGIGSVAVLMVSTLNRVMVVEYALPALVPGAFVALHYLVQLFRPRVGFRADAGARLSRAIIGGAALYASASVLCAASTLGLAHGRSWGFVLAIAGYALVGLGVGIAGTSLLILLSRRVEPRRRGSAACLLWIFMIAGFALTAGVSSRFLDPFSAGRLIAVTAVAAGSMFLVTVAAVWHADSWGIGAQSASRSEVGSPAAAARSSGAAGFAAVLRQVWHEPQARRFTLFVFISMLAYSAEEILLEPFAGVVFHYSLGMSARLSGLLHSSSLMGMCCVGILTSRVRGLSLLRPWVLAGCFGSAVALGALALASLTGDAAWLQPVVVALGLANGVFAVAAIGSMMESADGARAAHAGTRMGLWGAAQAIAFSFGGLMCAALVDALRAIAREPGSAFAVVFTIQAVLFIAAAVFAARSAIPVQSNSSVEALVT